MVGWICELRSAAEIYSQLQNHSWIFDYMEVSAPAFCTVQGSIVFIFNRSRLLNKVEISRKQTRIQNEDKKSLNTYRFQYYKKEDELDQL